VYLRSKSRRAINPSSASNTGRVLRSSESPPSEDKETEPVMGESRRGEARHGADFQANKNRFASTLVIGVCIVAAVRLARELGVDKPTLKITDAVRERGAG
jgi:hypothetical protein